MVITWDFDPIAFTIPFINLSVRWYGLMFAGGFLLGYYFVRRTFTQKKLNVDLLDSLLMYMFAGTIIGARLGHCFFYEPYFYLSHPLEILKIWNGGLASHGGGIGLVATVLLFCRLHKLNFLPLADLLCIPTAFVGGMIRLGNLFNSEIVGKATQSDTWGFIFLRLQEQIPVLRHPVQLYESISYFFISLLLLLIYKKFSPRFTGGVLGSFLTLVFSARIALEFFKPEQANYMSNQELLTVGQWLSVPFIVVGLVLILTSLLGFYKVKVICQPKPQV